MKNMEFLREFGIGQRLPDDPFFEDSYKVCKVFKRQGITIEDDEELCHEPMKEFPCNVPGCAATFESLLDFEIHYNGSHRYVCSECKKTRPNSRLLDIHIQETHDSFFKVLAERQPMHQCYVSECDLKFTNAGERREHCVTVHKFPKNFRFDDAVRQKGRRESRSDMDVDSQDKKPQCPKKPASNLNKNQKSRTFHSAMKHGSGNESTSEPSPDSSSRVQKLSSLSFIPRQVAQTSYTKLLTKNQNSEKNVLETDTLMDLAETLPQ